MSARDGGANDLQTVPASRPLFQGEPSVRQHKNIRIPGLDYTGTGWSRMNSNTPQHLIGVWGSSGSDIFAVGSEGTIVHYDGTNWNTMDEKTTRSLYGVWGSSGSDVFAVGRFGTILHYGSE